MPPDSPLNPALPASVEGANSEQLSPPRSARPTSQVVVALKASPEYGSWLAELAEHQRTRVAELVDQAIVHYAKTIGFEKPAPARFPKR